MKQLRAVLAIAAVSFVFSCTASKLDNVRAGVEASVAQLPRLKEFDTIKVVYQNFSFSAGGLTCYYGRAYVILGSSLSEKEALDAYFEALQLSGWVPRDAQYNTSRVLTRGAYELVEIRSGPPGVDIAKAVDYAQLRSVYESIIFVRVDLMLPSREEC